MANPEIESELDGIDRVSVCLYRLGLSLAALLLLCRGQACCSGRIFGAGELAGGAGRGQRGMRVMPACL